MEKNMTYNGFVRERISQLRIKKGVSEYQMSYDLGHSRGYINNISSGKALPSMSEFFAICDYFEITPQNFFNCECKYPELIQKVTAELSHLEEDDILMLLTFITRLSRK